MHRYMVLAKTDFNGFIARLATLQKLAAPVRRGERSYAFAEVTSGEEISLHYIPTILPPKKYFLPQHETLVEYDNNAYKWETLAYSEAFTIFAVHTCDLAGIQCLNAVFTDKPMDANYHLRKNRIAIIGLECEEYCDGYASCGLMHTYNPDGGYDLFFTDLSDRFLIHVNTACGEDLVAKTMAVRPAGDPDLAALQTLRARKQEIFRPELPLQSRDLKPLFERSFQHDVWREIHERCLSCCNCTNVCPTCYCYDMEDEINLDMNTGSLIRKWDSCQSRPFAMIASGENFRPERGARQRHRYMRKFNYPYDKYHRYFCTGCGRCSRTCMAGIDLKETIAALSGCCKADS